MRLRPRPLTPRPTPGRARSATLLSQDTCQHSCPAVLLSTAVGIEGPLGLSVDGAATDPASLRIVVCLDETCITFRRAPEIDAELIALCNENFACSPAGFLPQDPPNAAFGDVSRLVLIGEGGAATVQGTLYIPLARDASAASERVTITVTSEDGALLAQHEAQECVLRTTGCCVPSQQCLLRWP